MPTPPYVPERVQLSSLQADANNARRHDSRNMKAIADSLKKFGQVEPLVVQASSSRVIGGNGRLDAMRKLGWSEVDVVKVDIGDDEATALGVALNRSGELGNWDLGQLEKNLRGLKDNLDLTSLGFDDGELRRLLKSDQPLPQMPQAPAFDPGGDEGDEEDDGQNDGPSPAQAEQSTANGTGRPLGQPGDQHPDDDFERESSPVRQPRPVQLYFEGNDAQAFFEVVDLAAECMGTRGHAETVLASLRRVTGQSIFPENQ